MLSNGETQKSVTTEVSVLWQHCKYVILNLFWKILSLFYWHLILNKLMCLVLITILNLNTSIYPNAHFIYHRIFIFDTKIFHRLTIKIKLLCIFSLHLGWNIISKPRHSVRPITLLYIPTILIFICKITSRITGILL